MSSLVVSKRTSQHAVAVASRLSRRFSMSGKALPLAVCSGVSLTLFSGLSLDLRLLNSLSAPYPVIRDQLSPALLPSS
jgi:hypothetical protein